MAETEHHRPSPPQGFPSSSLFYAGLLDPPSCQLDIYIWMADSVGPSASPPEGCTSFLPGVPLKGIPLHPHQGQIPAVISPCILFSLCLHLRSVTGPPVCSQSHPLPSLAQPSGASSCKLVSQAPLSLTSSQFASGRHWREMGR